MNNMNKPENKNTPNNIEQYIHQRTSWLTEAANIVGGPEATLVSAFMEPTEVRADSPALDLTQEQEQSLREVAGRFGLGGERDVLSFADVDVIEGGKPWKVIAEATISDPTAAKIFAGSPFREIGQDETVFMQESYGLTVDDAMTEYDMVKHIARQSEGFAPLEEEEVLPFGYDIDNGFEIIQEQTEQLVKLGAVQHEDGSETDVIVLRVDRRNLDIVDGLQQYSNQPDSAAIMGIVSDVLTVLGDDESSVGMVTSSTYPSRAIDAVRAGLSKGREFRTGMYGRDTLAQVKGESVASPTDVNQIPGELYVLNQKLTQLSEEYSKK
ncbi:hypothetical protein BH23PAT2_BH23PAT2_03640 [soil metagenome]